MQVPEQKNEQLARIRKDCSDASAQELLRYFLDRFTPRIALASSMAAEDQVLTDMIVKINPNIPIFTIDTGRLPQETYDVIEATRKRYGISIRMLFPDYQQVEAVSEQDGPNSFYQSVDNRRQCCQIRKVKPLKRALAALEVWICGLRKEQSVTRDTLEHIQWDGQFGLIKLSPLADWTTEELWDYVHSNDVPYNKLHDKGYTSIGCAPCTRPVKTGEDIRAGRWWWEEPEHKECGLHRNAGQTGEQK